MKDSEHNHTPAALSAVQGEGLTSIADSTKSDAFLMPSLPPAMLVRGRDACVVSVLYRSSSSLLSHMAFAWVVSEEGGTFLFSSIAIA